MAPKLPLPRGWKRRVRSSVLHALVHPDFQLARFERFDVVLFKRPDSVARVFAYSILSRKVEYNVSAHS